MTQADELAAKGGFAAKLRRALARLNFYTTGRRVDELSDRTRELMLRLEQLAEAAARHDERQQRAEQRLDELEVATRSVQTELASLRDQSLVAVERRLDGVEAAARSHDSRQDELDGATRQLQAELARLRDEVVPASVARGNALLGRLSDEIDELASLVERLLLAEPLPSPLADSNAERELAADLAAIQPRLVEAFRGSEAEIGHRLDRYLEELAARAPVLDLGCGRGELLLMLREGGVAAVGIEADPALVQAARRRGLEVREGDVLELLTAMDEGSQGAVTAFHLFEHLPPAQLAAVLVQLRRVLRPGGLLLAEGPNPHSLRVAGSLHWLDPTHQHPLHPETLELYVRAAGLEPAGVEFLHPFEEEQLFVHALAGNGAEEADRRLLELATRLDELIHGARDFVLRARRPDHSS